MQQLNLNLVDWQTSLKNAITDPADLIDRLNLSPTLLEPAQAANQLFPLRVPLEFIARMEPGNPEDPLLKQVLPLGDELLSVPGFTEDPLQEAQSRPLPGLVHKYKDRVLLILSGACAVNCRYCFRRHFPYAENQISSEHWQQILEYLRQNTQIREVIFSGGDPLATRDERLARMVRDLDEISHLQRLRIHSRLPVVIPARVTPELVATLSTTRLNSVLVLHINHPQEIDQSLGDALQPLRRAGITLLNQAVFLKGINDSAEAQIELSHKLFAAGVLPYYLFLFDPVKGASHFDLPVAQAQKIAGEMQAALPGYLMPRLAKEIPGRPAKTLLLPDGNFLE